MKITTNEKYQEILEKYEATFKILNTGRNELQYLFPAMTSIVQFANEYGTKEFKDKLYLAYDKQVEQVLTGEGLYKEYKDTVKKYNSHQDTVLGRNPYARRKMVFYNMMHRDAKPLADIAVKDVDDKFIYTTDFKRMIQETASEFREINGIGTLFRMNRKYFILLLTDAQVVILDKEEELRKKADEKTLSIKKQVKKDSISLRVKDDSQKHYFTIVSVTKVPKYSEEEVLKRATEKTKGFPDEVYQAYEKDYQEYEKYFNKIHDIVKGLEIVSANFENPYSSSYKTIKTLEFCQSKLWELERQCTPTYNVGSLISPYAKEVYNIK